MKKSGKTNGANRNIRTLSRKDNAQQPDIGKKRNMLEQNTYQNNSVGLFATSNQHDRSNSQIPRGMAQVISKPLELSLNVQGNQQSVT